MSVFKSSWIIKLRKRWNFEGYREITSSFEILWLLNNKRQPEVL